MDMQVFYEVVVPLMEMDRTSLICISTVLGSDNFYSKLLCLKDDQGRSFFNKFEFYLACKACMDAGIASKCTHKMHELPHWQSSRKHARIRAMMSDQKELLERETMGIMHDSGDCAFEKRLVKRMMDRPGYPLTKTVRHIFVSIDPNAGGDSRFGICSCIYERGQLIIAGLDAVKSKNPAQYEPVLTEHIFALRKHQMTSRAIIVLMIESNLGFEAFHLQRFIKRSNLARYCVCMSDKDQKVGLRTTNPVKEAMWIKLRTFLEEDAVCFWDHLVTVNPEKNPKQMRKELRDELNQYKVMTELPKTVFQETKRTFTGKLGGSVDDLSVTLQLNALWHSEFFTAKYSDYH